MSSNGKTFIDFFCGAGGFSLGFIHAGFKHLFGVDNSKIACNIYRKNVGECYEADIRKFNAVTYKGYADVVIGGPPCQTFSVANTETRICDMSLVEEFFRVIKEIEPKIWIMENVPAIYPYLKVPFKKIFSMSEYGLLQQRKRCFASNYVLNPKKPILKYMTARQIIQQKNFRPEAIHRHFQTITCRYNSFSNTNPVIQDGEKLRMMSHTEALQIQTFPFYFKLPNMKQQEIETLIGNAVPPLFAYKLASSLTGKLEKQSVLLEG